MNPHEDFELEYHPSVDEDDKIIGKIWTRRQALTAGSLASLATLFGCGGGGGASSSGTSGGTSAAITTQPTSATAVVGTSATFAVVATGSSLSYQWYSAVSSTGTSTKIAGATGASYTLGSVTIAMSGTTYHVVVTGSNGSATSNNATLTVTATATTPTITTQPTGVSANVGSTVAFTVVASGTNLTYQWYKGGTAGSVGSGGTAVSGATNATLAFAAAASTDAGTYYVVVTNTVGAVTSTAVLLTVNDTVPTITTQPSSATVSAGGTATFTVVASGTNLTYQWYRGGVAASGATSASYALSSVATGDSGATFDVKVTNSAGSVTSNTVTLTVGTGIDLVVTPQAIEGPFWVDENLNVSNLLAAGSSRSTVTGGFPLTLAFTLYRYDASTATGTPLAGAHVDIWHADAIGTYSDEASGSIQSENTTGQTWLRGYQVTDANGGVTFHTIHPGWYTGRTPHVHVRIRTYSASGNVTHNLTTQMFFTDAQNAAILSKSIYAHGTRTVFDANDNVYSVSQSDGTAVGSHLLLNVDQGLSSETASFSLAFVLP